MLTALTLISDKIFGISHSSERAGRKYNSRQNEASVQYHHPMIHGTSCPQAKLVDDGIPTVLIT
jgi:hypothetical protein